jgi:hypothetical protein
MAALLAPFRLLVDAPGAHARWSRLPKNVGGRRLANNRPDCARFGEGFYPRITP